MYGARPKDFVSVNQEGNESDNGNNNPRINCNLPSSSGYLPKPRILDSFDSEAEEKKSLIDSGSEQDIENRAFSPRTRKYHFINIYCHYYYNKYICNKFQDIVCPVFDQKIIFLTRMMMMT
jgi:hypothetical protein